MKDFRTLVLNADYMPLSIIGWQRAMVLMFRHMEDVKKGSDVVDFYDNAEIQDSKGHKWPVPAVIVNAKYVRRNYRKVPFNRKNVLLRDKCICQYCGVKFPPSELEYEHVIPRSTWKRLQHKDTPTCWTNIVLACTKCNRRKADRSCEQAKMFPRNAPRVPNYGEILLGINPWIKNTPEKWMPYLKHLPGFKDIMND